MIAIGGGDVNAASRLEGQGMYGDPRMDANSRFQLGRQEYFHHEGTKRTKEKERAALRDFDGRSVTPGIRSS